MTDALKRGDAIWVRVSRTDHTGTHPEWVEDYATGPETTDEEGPCIETADWDTVGLSEVRRRGPSPALLAECRAWLKEPEACFVDGPRLLTALLASLEPPREATDARS